jgi:membrane-associated phospholipid phosphatase
MNPQRTKIQFIVFVLLLATACKEDIPIEETIPVQMPVSLDENAGDWQTVIAYDYLSNSSIPTADDINSETYGDELNRLVDLSNATTHEQQSRVNYWGAGGVLRWNQLLRTLIAKYNVPLPAGAIPDPEKPVASPPFAARAYALLSVAQHDALIATWQLKYSVNRPTPEVSEPLIKRSLPMTNLPSFPSEQAVIASVSQKILSTLFPLEKASIDAMALEHINTIGWSGTGTESDIFAGTVLGDEVATIILAHAKNDRMDLARDPEKTYLTYFNINASTVPNPWISISNPQTDPLLPMFGRVKTWLDSTEVFAAMPPPPPNINSDEFKEDIAYVYGISKNRSREQWRIADYWADGAGTFTPPGHWNLIAEKLIVGSKWSEVRTARAFSLLNRAMLDSGILCWYAKYKYYVPRPSQVNPKIKIATGIPNFPSYTSGHSSFSASAGTVLGHLFPDQKGNLTNQYLEAGISRVYGGIHYMFDNIEGRKSGILIGELMIDNAISDGADL